MSVPASPRVTVVQATAEPPRLAHGFLRAETPDHLDIALDADAPAMGPGAPVVVDFPDLPDRARVIGVVEPASAGALRVAVRRAAAPDKREYPRVEGAVHLEYHRGDALDAWLAGGPATAPVRRPDPFMNFSVVGLQFEDEPACAEGDTVLFELSVPHDRRRFRGAARVVRVLPIPPAEREAGASHRVAIAFTHLPTEAADALREQTLRIQEALLR